MLTHKLTSPTPLTPGRHPRPVFASTRDAIGRTSIVIGLVDRIFELGVVEIRRDAANGWRGGGRRVTVRFARNTLGRLSHPRVDSARAISGPGPAGPTAAKPSSSSLSKGESGGDTSATPPVGGGSAASSSSSIADAADLASSAAAMRSWSASSAARRFSASSLTWPLKASSSLAESCAPEGQPRAP